MVIPFIELYLSHLEAIDWSYLLSDFKAAAKKLWKQ